MDLEAQFIPSRQNEHLQKSNIGNALSSDKSDADSDNVWENTSKHTHQDGSFGYLVGRDERDRAPGPASLCRAWCQSRQIVRSLR